MFMRVVGLSFGLAWMLVAPPASAETWALLVGVSHYTRGAVRSLQYPASDAAAFRGLLVDPQFGGVPAGHVRLLTDQNATAANINSGITDFLAPNVKPGDQVILLLAGHGVTKGVGITARGFFLPSDVTGVSLPALGSSAIDLYTLSNQLSQLPAGQFVLFVDACRDDPAPDRGIKDNPLTDVIYRSLQVLPAAEHTPSAVTFFACGMGQNANEDSQFQHGVFTHWLLEAVRKGGVPRQADGSVEMGRLAAYVSQKVNSWAEQESQARGLDIEQSPTLVATHLDEPLILMRVRQPGPEAAVQVDPARVNIATLPEGAEVSLGNPGASVSSQGASPLFTTLPGGGSLEIQVKGPGFKSQQRTVKLFDGYQLQATVPLSPDLEGMPLDLYRAAASAERRHQWQEAADNYRAIIQAAPTFVPVYELLADLYLPQRYYQDATADLIQMINNVPNDAHSLSVLAHNYGTIAAKGPGKAARPQFEKRVSYKGYEVPGDDTNKAARLAGTAAKAALAEDSSSVEARLASAFAQIATSTTPRDVAAALDQFEKAVQALPNDARTHFGLGYGLRVSALLQGQQDRQSQAPVPPWQRFPVCQAPDATLRRAYQEQQEAIRLYPDFYDAWLERAFCAHLLGLDREAEQAYKQTNAHRLPLRPGLDPLGVPTLAIWGPDKHQMAAINLALASLYKKQSRRRNDDYDKAANGYIQDAIELASDGNRIEDLRPAVCILNGAGLNESIRRYLPSRVMELCHEPSSHYDPRQIAGEFGSPNNGFGLPTGNPTRPNGNTGKPTRNPNQPDDSHRTNPNSGAPPYGFGRPNK